MPFLTPIDIYLSYIPETYRVLLQDLRKTILEVIPGAEEGITYQIPTFKVNGKAVTGFAAFKNHCSFLPFSGSVLSQFKDELKEYKQTKSSLHFTTQQTIPADLVQKMIEAKLLINSKTDKTNN